MSSRSYAGQYAYSERESYGYGNGYAQAYSYAYADEEPRDLYWYGYGSEAPALAPEDEAYPSEYPFYSDDPAYPYPAADPARRKKEVRDSRARARQRAEAQRRNAVRNRVLIAFMVGVMGAMSLVLVYYISLQADVTNAVNEIASLETQLSSLKSDNDETLNEINSKINLDEIKYRAMADLGMTYADKDQIITYSNDSGDYVRQVQQVGN